MKLTINAQEVLALYNHLSQRFGDFAKEDKQREGDAQLLQVYNRLKSVLISALKGHIQDPVDAYLKGQQDKIDRLNEELEDVREEQVEIAKSDPDMFVPKAGEDLEVSEYPRRVPRGPRPGKYHGRFKG